MGKSFETGFGDMCREHEAKAIAFIINKEGNVSITSSGLSEGEMCWIGSVLGEFAKVKIQKTTLGFFQQPDLTSPIHLAKRLPTS